MLFQFESHNIVSTRALKSIRSIDVYMYHKLTIQIILLFSTWVNIFNKNIYINFKYFGELAYNFLSIYALLCEVSAR